MGAFFICDKSKVHDYSPALELFSEMGFSSPDVIESGDMNICVYTKMATKNCNVAKDGELTLVLAGSPIYKGMNYDNSLSALLSDYRNNCVAYEQLIGQYTILFCQADKIEILRDPLGCKHLFTDKHFSMLSSHMLPICQCIEGDLHINRMAFYEKLLTGIIMPPNTIFDEISSIDDHVADAIKKADRGISFIQTPKLPFAESKKQTIETCLAEQEDTLRNYFESVRNAAENGVDVGLSGGYDSRLVLACLNKYIKTGLHLHSHSTENIHKKDLQIAKQMADYIGISCHVTATKRLSHCDTIDDVLRKSVLYFDGRSSFSIGGCGEVYTAAYRSSSTENIPLTLTGIGGELYRNVFDIGFKSIRFDHFMKEKVFSHSFPKAVSEDLFYKISNDIIERAASRLDVDKHQMQSKAVAHRYYCEIMMPDGQGVALDAYNQVSCCAAPFLEPKIIIKGYETIPFHKSGGEFEGKLIEYVDPGLAAIPSSYGYPIGKRPLKAKVKESLRAYMPASVWEKLSALINKKDQTDVRAALDELYAGSQTLREAYIFMIEFFPEINFSFLLRSNEDIRRIQFIAMTLYMFRERIKTK